MKKHIIEFNKEDRVAIPLSIFLNKETPHEATEKDLLNFDGIKIEKTNKKCRLIFSSWNRMEEILNNISNNGKR